MKSQLDVAIAKTAPEVVPVPVLNKMETLALKEQQIRDKAKAAMDAELAEVKLARDLEAAKQRPLHEMLLKREQALTIIASGERQRNAQDIRAGEYRAAMHAAFANENGALGEFYHFHSNPALSIAERLLAELDKWLTERRAEIPPLDKACRDYAAEHNLQDQLPAELR